MESNKVILIGVDGLGWSEIDEWLNTGELPTLSGLLAMNSKIECRSTHPPWTPCAWPSLMSGRNPGKHGVFDFFTRDGYEKDLVNRSDVDSPYIFEVADAMGIPSIAINFPVTNPPSKLEHGAIVPGYLAQEDTEFHPEGLREEFESKYGEYSIYPDYTKKREAVDEYVGVAENRRDMAQFLDSKFDWGLLGVQFQVTDSVFHSLDDREMIRDVLKRVDSFINDIIELGDEDTSVFIVSDHGMGDYYWTFYVNTWLNENGYCEVTQGSPRYFRQEKDGLKGNGVGQEDTGLISKITHELVSTLSAVGLSPQLIHSRLSKIGLANHLQRIIPDETLIAAQNQVVDHAHSSAFQIYFNSFGINLNVKGREPNGIIPPEEYPSVRSELMDELEEIRDPDGNKVFDSVDPREDIYEGDHLDDAPDIVLTPRDFRYDISGSILDTFRRNIHKNHRPDGILLSNRSLNNHNQIDIYDIAPTIAAELGIALDTKTDGEVLTRESQDYEEQEWDSIAEGYGEIETESDTSSVEERLSNLGYME